MLNCNVLLDTNSITKIGRSPKTRLGHPKHHEMAQKRIACSFSNYEEELQEYSRDIPTVFNELIGKARNVLK
ncbi:hypothetical protein M758_3G253500 [Ceratodon purpureus]|nr:hypothetical protein M758_3G253500 [Ceratodon purpureus]